MHHVNVFFVVSTLVGMLLPVLAPSDNRRAGRRVFWAGFLIASVSAFFIAYPPDWKSGAIFSLLTCFLMLLPAYFSSPYIKIRGKVYAFNLRDSRPDPSPTETSASGSDDSEDDPAPDSYSGMASAKKTWWLLVVCMIISVGAIDLAKPWHTATSAGIVVVFACGIGYGDASWGYPVARGQRAQFVAVSIITAGVFTACYFGAYWMGKRRPLRSKQSMEYRAHSRHQKRF